MKSETRPIKNEHICSRTAQNEFPDSEPEFDESNDVTYNYDDVQFSDDDYDSDEMERDDEKRQLESKLRSRTHNTIVNPVSEFENEEKKYLIDDENEFSENENKLTKKKKAQQHAKKLNVSDIEQWRALGSSFEGKLNDGSINWIETFETPKEIENSDPKTCVLRVVNPGKYVDLQKFPPGSRKKSRSKSKSPRMFVNSLDNYYPAKHIQIKVGNSTFIEFKPKKSNALCKFVLNGGQCVLGNKCRFSHEQIQKICNSIRDGKECMFGNRCKFLHIIKQKPQKPDCKYGIKCLNKKCTFIHPNGKNIPVSIQSKQMEPQKDNTSFSDESIGSQRERNISRCSSNASSKDNPSNGNELSRKIWLCKNKFKISKTDGNIYECFKIEERGTCKFGDHCIYAHSIEDVRQGVQSCRFAEKCKGINIIYIQKDNQKVRRYENNSETRKCCRLHPKERMLDFTKRIQPVS
jgi:hypothetical protein